MRMRGRNHTAAFKAKVALAALKGDRTPAGLAEKYDVHARQITQWKTQLLDGAIGVFMSPAEKRGTVAFERADHVWAMDIAYLPMQRASPAWRLSCIGRRGGFLPGACRSC